MVTIYAAGPASPPKNRHKDKKIVTIQDLTMKTVISIGVWITQPRLRA